MVSDPLHFIFYILNSIDGNNDYFIYKNNVSDFDFGSNLACLQIVAN